MDKVSLGSKTAKDGFQNEKFVIETFNAWKSNELAQEWLKAMNYKIQEIESVKAEKIKGSYKADVQVVINVTIKLKKLQDVQNIQVKLASNPQGFNQIDKRYLKSYVELWNLPNDILEILQYFVGEKLPKINNPKDSRRMFFYEFSTEEQEKILKYFTENKILILNDILKGRGKFASEWFLVILKMKYCEPLKWRLKPINEVINFYNGEVKFSSQGSLKIGKITMQRKGGDNGRDTAKMLQFKINPCELFEIE
ncbi:type II restriction endonuclease [Helicobacter saguini]|uniref:Type II restriction endonuclease n=1 Tax=Helicobacter saguini TaxID=1548018 RepID=A0A347VNV2_9HELI|nr:type II R-M system restriction endonuclease [Helicobacter saguini]MWV61627.1 type II restriction endonuclease [Helicobacter saguini]MWV67701.1 type II restriction endonuclease [Helicobacter saguini]MWV70053.1 type II restriction endonuclease [Helicobacter saguini]MWV72734.1 type II restriction endonuclease [Helicobacter saguini]TLD91388.1 type II restriction endonuclease [Helicobacter saguini]